MWSSLSLVRRGDSCRAVERRSSLAVAAVGAVDLEFLDLLARFNGSRCFQLARKRYADGPFRGAGLGGLMMGLRPLAGCALGAHVSPRRVGQRAPGASTKGLTERAQLELTARGGDHLRGHGRARDGGSGTFFACLRNFLDRNAIQLLGVDFIPIGAAAYSHVPSPGTFIAVRSGTYHPRV